MESTSTLALPSPSAPPHHLRAVSTELAGSIEISATWHGGAAPARRPAAASAARLSPRLLSANCSCSHRNLLLDKPARAFADAAPWPSCRPVPPTRDSHSSSTAQSGTRRGSAVMMPSTSVRSTTRWHPGRRQDGRREVGAAALAWSAVRPPWPLIRSPPAVRPRSSRAAAGARLLAGGIHQRVALPKTAL